MVAISSPPPRMVVVLEQLIIYKRTRNPYIAGLINAMFIVMISCSNTTTILGGGELIATTF